MRHRKPALLLAAVAACALCWSSADAHGAMGGGRTGGFAHFGGFHRLPVPVGHVRFRFRRPLRGLRFRAFPESTVTVVGDDDTDDYDAGDNDGDLADMHFRVEDNFGPWDVPIRPVIAEPDGPWTGTRMDPWHGYEPENAR